MQNRAAAARTPFRTPTAGKHGESVYRINLDHNEKEEIVLKKNAQ